MNFEDRIKETLMNRSSDVQQQPDSFEQVSSTVRRRHIQRLTLVATSIVALAAAAAVVVPRLGSEPRDDFAVPPDDPTPTTEPTTAPAPPDGWVTMRDERWGFQAYMPADWRVTEFEGVIELLPPGQVGLAAGEPTFAVEINLLEGSPTNFSAPDDSTTPTETTVGGRSALVTTYGSEGGSQRGAFYALEWDAAFCQPDWCTEARDYTMLVHVIANPAARWDSFGDDAEQLVESVQPTTAGYPAGTVVTRRGSISEEVTWDEATQLLVRFLEARVFGGDAEGYLASSASVDDDTLYRVGEEVILTYEVTGRAGVDANAWEFTVAVETLGPTATETIGIGAEDGGVLVRFVQREGS